MTKHETTKHTTHHTDKHDAKHENDKTGDVDSKIAKTEDQVKSGKTEDLTPDAGADAGSDEVVKNSQNVTNKPSRVDPKTGETISRGQESKKVKMRFSEPKFYNDQNVPMFEAGKVYELEGADWIDRWLKRGGWIVEGDEKVEKPGKHSSKDKAGKQSKDNSDL